MKNWKEEENRLRASFKFEDFVQAFGFMTQVAIVAEKQDHHPNWYNVYNEVHFELSTHEAGDVVTEKDRQLASEIDKIYKVFSVSPDQ